MCLRPGWAGAGSRSGRQSAECALLPLLARSEQMSKGSTEAKLVSVRAGMHLVKAQLDGGSGLDLEKGSDGRV